MSDIPRWAYQYGGMTPFHPSPGGGWVAYADHAAALLTQDRQFVAAAEQRGIQKALIAWQETDPIQRAEDFARGVQAARDAVEALSYDDLSRDQGPDATKRQALAAIDGVEKP